MAVWLPSMLSGWELGRHTTSIGHRKTLCEIYGKPPQSLFAHQDYGLRTEAAPKLLAGVAELREAMLVTVRGARECLVAGGSRSRDTEYLEAIEAVLAERPALVHYRVLFGPPHHQTLKDHLLRLLELRNPAERSLGIKTPNLGIVNHRASRCYSAPMGALSPTLDATFFALSDPKRRGILERLGRGPATLSQLARPSGLTLNGIKKHVGILELAGLVETEKVGRVRECRLGPVTTLGEAGEWIEAHRRAWEGRLDRFEHFVERER